MKQAAPAGAGGRVSDQDASSCGRSPTRCRSGSWPWRPARCWSPRSSSSWLAPDRWRDVALILIAFVFPLQLLTSVLSFLGARRRRRHRHGHPRAAPGCRSAWLLTSPPGATSDALGLFLLMAGVAMWAPASAAAAASSSPPRCSTTAGLRFLLTGAYELSVRDLGAHRGGRGADPLRLGIYTAYAMVLEDELRRPVLPLGRRRPIHGEPGVREEL